MDWDLPSPPILDDVDMDDSALPPSPPPPEESCPYQHFSRKQLIALVEKYKTALEKLYTKDQIDALTGDDKRPTYSLASIEKSAHLRYVCGFTGTIIIKYLLL